jgi:putative ABC transport system substrate-binding protein
LAEGKTERLASLAAEPVRLKVEVIVIVTNPSVLAVKRATSTIPIVMTIGIEPVASGFVASLAHPGGSITGLLRTLRLKRLRADEMIHQSC